MTTAYAHQTNDLPPLLVALIEPYLGNPTALAQLHLILNIAQNLTHFDFPQQFAVFNQTTWNILHWLANDPLAFPALSQFTQYHRMPQNTHPNAIATLTASLIATTEYALRTTETREHTIGAQNIPHVHWERATQFKQTLWSNTFQATLVVEHWDRNLPAFLKSLPRPPLATL